MLAGVIGAALTGFLLTAIPNWTGGAALSGLPLMLLPALFLAARLVLLPGSPVPAGRGGGRSPCCRCRRCCCGPPALVKAATPRLFGPPVLILAFWAGDLLMLGDAAGWWARHLRHGRVALPRRRPRAGRADRRPHHPCLHARALKAGRHAAEIRGRCRAWMRPGSRAARRGPGGPCGAGRRAGGVARGGRRRAGRCCGCRAGMGCGRLAGRSSGCCTWPI